MADEGSGYKHDSSDKALDKSAKSANEKAEGSDTLSARAGHDPAEIRKHDDVGKDRLFEGREQHDEADKNSEKNRLAKDVDRHHHATDENVADSATGPSAKHKG